MLVIAGRFRIDPSHRAELVAAAREIMRETQREAGCAAYEFSADLDDPAVFHLFEQWESPEALAAHFETPHMAKFRSLLPGLGVLESRVQRYEVASASPLGA